MIMTLEGRNCGGYSMAFVALKLVEPDKCIMVQKPNLCTEHPKINRFLKNAS